MINIFRSKKKNPSPAKSELRPSEGQGPYTSFMNKYVPRKVDPEFYEVLREAIPLIDAAIWKLVALDGHMVVRGDNAALVDEIQEWMDYVRVNEMQTGLQAFHQSISNETFEQGFGLGEFVTDRKRTDIVQLKVADSKTIRFGRIAGGGMNIYQQVAGDHNPVLLNRNNLIYQSIHNENQNPYGTSIIRSMEFVGKVLATMHNSLLNVWERFGDPSFHVSYKAGSKRSIGEDTLETRRKAISDEFNTAIRKKREGYSYDFVTAVDKDSDMQIQVIGAEGQLLELEVPVRHVVEQILAKTDLPSWMLGLHWSTTERLADKEVTMLQESRLTRHKAKLPIYTNLIRTLLLLRGRTWKPGDWKLEFEQLNLHDLVKEAQARFLNLQGDYYIVQNAETMGTSVDINQLSDGKAYSRNSQSTTIKSPLSCGCKGHEDIDAHKELHRPVEWPQLDKLEDEYEGELKYEWEQVQEKILNILNLHNKGKAEFEFLFNEQQRALIMKALADYHGIFNITNPDSPVRWYYGQSYSLGLIQAANMMNAEFPVLNTIRNQETLDELAKSGFQRVKERSTLHIKDRILPEIEAQVMAGTNPTHVASRLKKIFGNANSDWNRLARSELAMAAEQAKLDEWKVRGVNISKAPLPVRDTHPRCRCSNTLQQIEGKWYAVFLPAPDACPQCASLAGEVEQ